MSLKTNQVTYINTFVRFKDSTTVKYPDPNNNHTKYLTVKHYIIIIGGRPRYPDIPGINLTITGDDIY